MSFYLVTSFRSERKLKIKGNHWISIYTKDILLVSDILAISLRLYLAILQDTQVHSISPELIQRKYLQIKEKTTPEGWIILFYNKNRYGYSNRQRCFQSKTSPSFYTNAQKRSVVFSRFPYVCEFFNPP